jgi:D-3-phosphoglycerate dehydrogenase
VGDLSGDLDADDVCRLPFAVCRLPFAVCRLPFALILACLATQLLTIGCFCIGTNQVDLDAAAKAGIAVFNSPFANSRSVAELVISEIIALSRQLGDRSREMREGIWNKVSKGCWEIRGKTLGIVGYGHIGSQLSVLAEAFGMQVLYYDVVPIMPLGSARQTETLEQLLGASDFVTLHVPELEETKNMIGATEIGQMKQGAYLINNSRGKVVHLPALVDALESGHLAGTAVDVFPSEPGSNGPGFNDNLGDFIPRLRKCPNTILTPHIGGSTEEAQRAIGQEVASALTRYLNFGTSVGAVNFPEVDLRAITMADDRHIRVCHLHTNAPGVLKGLNKILGNFNITKQFTDSKGDIAYLLADVSDVSLDQIREIYAEISEMSTTIKTRLLCESTPLPFERCHAVVLGIR